MMSKFPLTQIVIVKIRVEVYRTLGFSIPIRVTLQRLATISPVSCVCLGGGAEIGARARFQPAPRILFFPGEIGGCPGSKGGERKKPTF